MTGTIAFRISVTFTDSLTHLTGSEQKTVNANPKAEINAEAWATLNSDISQPFEKPQSGRIAVKVINHLGDEVMKVFKV